LADGARLYSCDIVCGAPVVGAGRLRLGTVDELLLDVESGQVGFVVLSCGGDGVTGAGQRRVVIPWRWLRYEPRLQQFALTVDRRALDRAPAFGQDAWPDFSDAHLQRRITAYFDDSAPRRAPELSRMH
jgi:hypothetical protein